MSDAWRTIDIEEAITILRKVRVVEVDDCWLSHCSVSINWKEMHDQTFVSLYNAAKDEYLDFTVDQNKRVTVDGTIMQLFAKNGGRYLLELMNPVSVESIQPMSVSREG